MYIHTKIPLEKTGQFSKGFIQYIQNQDLIQNFFNTYPSIDNFKKIIEDRKFEDTSREILHEVIFDQYSQLDCSPSVRLAMESIKDQKTFTVTTGHQLCLFTGPLYFIYKIVTTIRLSRKLKESYPDYNFIPIYWMATEDHDFEEINHFYLFNKRFAWQTNQEGAVGRFNTLEIKDIFESIQDKLPLFEASYLQNKTLGESTRSLINELFGDHGLLIIDGDSKKLKERFKEVIKADIFENLAFNHVSTATKELEDLGVEPQIQAREINFFYLDGNIRERIIKDKEQYKVLNTELRFSREELQDLINSSPESFSPNVALRPLYQEIVLPNLAYIGGPSEVVYWLQLKSFFEASKVDFPMLVPRNFALVVNKAQHEKLNKLHIEMEDLFQDEKRLKESYLNNNYSPVLDAPMYEEQFTAIFDEIKSKAIAVDKTLELFVEAQKREAFKILGNIDKKLVRALENKESEGVNQVLNLHSKLFPDGSLQERRDNFLNFYLNKPDFVETLLQLLDPLDFQFNILVEEA